MATMEGCLSTKIPFQSTILDSLSACIPVVMSATRCQFRYHDARFHCGQINILMVLNYIGPEDGATMVILGSHKSKIIHPEFGQVAMRTETGTSLDGITGAVVYA